MNQVLAIAFSGIQGVRSRKMALRMTSKRRIRATRATKVGLPRRRNRS